jgi:hypothetical protein
VKRTVGRAGNLSLGSFQIAGCSQRKAPRQLVAMQQFRNKKAWEQQEPDDSCLFPTLPFFGA